MLGDATATLEDGVLRLEIDLRPPSLRTFLTLGRRHAGRASENSAAPSLNVVSAFARSPAPRWRCNTQRGAREVRYASSRRFVA